MRAARPPLSRYRIYGGPGNHLRFARDLIAGRLHTGGDVARLEAACASLFGAAHCVALPMARVALCLVARYYAGRGGEVMLSPYTVADVVNAVLAGGARPRFVDVDPVTGNMSPDALRKAIRPATAAVLVTHLHGVPAAMEEIGAVTRAAGVPLIEDAAQSMGAVVGDRRVGTLGEAGVFSLGLYKNVNSWYGGLVVTRDRSLAEALRVTTAQWPWFPTRILLRRAHQAAIIQLLGAPVLFGRGVFPVLRHGVLRDLEAINRVTRIELDASRRETLPAWYLGRYTPAQARLALRQLPTLDDHARERIARARVYSAALPCHPGLLRPPEPDGLRHVYTYYAVRVRGRENLLKWLAFFRRDVAAQHLRNCAELSGFRELGDSCPVASEVARSVVLLPTYPGYDEAQIRLNAAVLRWYFARGEPRFESGTARAVPGELLDVTGGQSDTPRLDFGVQSKAPRRP